jgi:hypothetical protein
VRRPPPLLLAALASAALVSTLGASLAAAGGRPGGVAGRTLTTTTAPPPDTGVRAAAARALSTALTTTTTTAATTTCAAARIRGPGATESEPASQPETERPCWIDVKPYPFGSYTGPSGVEEAGPVEIENPRWVNEHPQCLRHGINPVTRVAGEEDECFLTATSMAFRSWNHGLAATYPTSENSARAALNPYGVWIYDGRIENGPQWYPDPTFPGHKACPGHTIVWAGKLDYWLVGGPTDTSWSRLCRYDGVTGQWQSFSLPSATLVRITLPSIPPIPLDRAPRAKALQEPITQRGRRPGGITAAACLAWNNCWFFGTYGTVVRWDGITLRDASPSLSQRWLDGEYLAAATNEYPLGNPFAVAVSSTAEDWQPNLESELIPARPSGGKPPELFASLNGEFTLGALGSSSALPFEPPSEAQDGTEHRPPDPVSGWIDPYRTDLVAVGFDEAGHGWVAGDPAVRRANWNCRGGCQPAPEKRGLAGPDAPAPLVPVSLGGAKATCTEGAFAPEELRFSALASPAEPGSFLWSSLAVLPGSGEALAGGLMKPPVGEGTEANRGNRPEPVIVQASCEGALTVTRFRVDESPLGQPERVSADREGVVTAIVASARNDAWAATGEGTLIGPPEPGVTPPRPELIRQPPHLYRLTNGGPPEAPEGNDEEARFEELQENPPVFVFEPEPEQPVPPTPPPITNTHTTREPPAVYGLRANLHRHGNTFSLYLSFKLRRPVTIGAEGLRHGRVVARARPRHFTGRKGLLILPLDRKHWPTQVRFTS